MHCQISSCTVGQHTQPPQRSMNPPIIFRKDYWLQYITVLLLTALPLTQFSLGGRSVGVAFFCFCCVLVLVDFWLLSASVGVWLLLTLLFGFWLLLVLACVFGLFLSHQATHEQSERMFLWFSICSFCSLHSPTTPPHICHIFTHVHVFHVMFLQFLWMISQTSRIWQDFRDLAVLFHFSICLCQHSLNIATWEHHLSNWKETAAKSTGAWNILARSKEHSVNRRNHEIGTKN